MTKTNDVDFHGILEEKKNKAKARLDITKVRKARKGTRKPSSKRQAELAFFNADMFEDDDDKENNQKPKITKKQKLQTEKYKKQTTDIVQDIDEYLKGMEEDNNKKTLAKLEKSSGGPYDDKEMDVPKVTVAEMLDDIEGKARKRIDGLLALKTVLRNIQHDLNSEKEPSNIEITERKKQLEARILDEISSIDRAILKAEYKLEQRKANMPMKPEAGNKIHETESNKGKTCQMTEACKATKAIDMMDKGHGGPFVGLESTNVHDLKANKTDVDETYDLLEATYASENEEEPSYLK